MVIKLEKILDVSLTEYCEHKKVHSSDYNLVGVHCTGHYDWNGLRRKKSPKEDFAEKVPGDAEAVISYRIEFMDDHFYEANGTALIPKEPKTKKLSTKKESFSIRLKTPTSKTYNKEYYKRMGRPGLGSMGKGPR